MHINLPDPHPGRCQNTRHRYVGNGEWETVRCLDYEAADHRCTFPPLRTITAAHDWTGNSYSHKAEKPKPWVKPDA